LTQFLKPGQQHCVTGTKPRKPLARFSKLELVLTVKASLILFFKKKKEICEERPFLFWKAN